MNESQNQSLALTFLASVGRSDIVQIVHPDDEMYLTLAGAVSESGSALLEYFKSGHEARLTLDNLLDSSGRQWSELESVLDFACGYGRVTRHLLDVVPPGRLCAGEILEDAVSFVRETLGVRTIHSATDPGAVDLGSGHDLIFVASLFSHLPRTRFSQWLGRLYESLAPTGILAFSTHGPEVVPEIQKHSSGFTFVPLSESRNLSTSEYGSTFVSRAVVEEIASECGVAHLAGVDRDLWALQDLFAASPSPLPEASVWQNTSRVRGAVDQVQFGQRGQFRIDGWAAEDHPGERVISVDLFAGERAVGSAKLGIEREDVARTMLREDWHGCGWYCEGSIGDTPSGPYDLLAHGRSSSGREMCFDVRRVRVP